MSIWDDAGAAIDAAFADPDPIYYYDGTNGGYPIRAIRSEQPAQAFDGPGSTLRTISFEISQVDLMNPPRKTDKFHHRGIWCVPENITRRDDIGKFTIVVALGEPIDQ
jgi:hypothetical protein